jgi:hypothetical protein
MPYGHVHGIYVQNELPASSIQGHEGKPTTWCCQGSSELMPR